MQHTGSPFRALRFGDVVVDIEHRADGVTHVRPKAALGPYPERITDRLEHWARVKPDHVFIAQREAEAPHEWRSLTYAQTLTDVRRIASGLIARGLSAERPVVILSGNSIEHALVALGALYAGIPFCPVSPPYALVSKDFAKLRYVMELLTPGLVFVDSAIPFANAIAAAVAADVEVVAAHGTLEAREITQFAALLATPEHPDLDAVHSSIGPDTIAKFLLTSGSTGNPKAVINTQQMMCANQQMILNTMAFLDDPDLLIVDWLPWNHTFGGNHNVGLILYNGGSLYIDDGKPVPSQFDTTLRNLRELSPTVYFNVPKGFEMLVAALRQDFVLRKTFFAKLQCMFFAGASLPAHIWNALDELSVEQTGARIPMLTGLGSTETAPFSMSATPKTSRSGHVGLPVSGNEIKLVPNGGKLEVRVKGPNVTPGYWRQPEMTAKAFDDEGFYMFGDALKPVEPDNYHAGFDFDGRISEDFKLGSGTWVSVGPLRARLIAACAPLVRDAVIAGLDRDDLAAILILDPDGCHTELPHLAGQFSTGALADDPGVRALLAEGLARFAQDSTGSATRVNRALILDSALSIDAGEITDKGSVNQRAVLECRADLVNELYAPQRSARIVIAAKG